MYSEKQLVMIIVRQPVSIKRFEEGSCGGRRDLVRLDFIELEDPLNYLCTCIMKSFTPP